MNMDVDRRVSRYMGAPFVTLNGTSSRDRLIVKRESKGGPSPYSGWGDRTKDWSIGRVVDMLMYLG